MEFHTLQEFYTFTKGNVYLIMGGVLIAATLFWQFLMGGKDDSPSEYDEAHDHHQADA